MADEDKAAELQVLTGSCGSRCQVEALSTNVQTMLAALTKTPAMAKIRRSLEDMASLRARLLAFRDALDDAPKGANAAPVQERDAIHDREEMKQEPEEDADNYGDGPLAIEAAPRPTHCK